MGYFIFRWALSTVLSALLLLLLLHFSKYCKLRNLKKKIAFFFPTIVSIVLVIHVMSETGPKTLDLLRMAGNRYEVKQVKVLDVKPLHRVTMSDGLTYYFDGFSMQFEEGETYQISSTYWSHYIAEAKNI